MINELFLAGLSALQDYVATHVLTCLVPAFLLAGAMVTFIDRDLILVHLGDRASKVKSFSLAAAGSFLLAACSCTVIPVASGLYFAGAGVGAVFILLWVAPASNILALVYTGNILGAEMVISRIIAALLMAILVGTVMSIMFKSEQTQSQLPKKNNNNKQLISKHEFAILVLILSSLLLPNYLMATKPYLYKVITWATCTLVLACYAWKMIPQEKIKIWLTETWWFVRTIFPLLLGGVFLVGVIGKILPQEWIQHWLGGNSLLASFLGSLLGSVTYFATMTEAPFVDTLMGLGMGKGPALALLLTGPGVSLPNWLAIGRVLGWKKAFVYVPIIILSGTIMGWFFGNYIF
ncbi:MAG: permease [Desulfobulbaceae bacterium]|nr:permease [Desulfobulbaceae bacterium]